MKTSGNSSQYQPQELGQEKINKYIAKYWLQKIHKRNI